MDIRQTEFRLGADARASQLAAFNRRSEVVWFGFSGSFHEPGLVRIAVDRMQAGVLGGGGEAALNGGVISAGFDAAFVLAGLGHYDTPVVVTVELSVKFLALAVASRSPVFEACVVRSTKALAFVEGRLVPQGEANAQPFAIASGIVAPRA